VQHDVGRWKAELLAWDDAEAACQQALDNTEARAALLVRDIEKATAAAAQQQLQACLHVPGPRRIFTAPTASPLQQSQQRILLMQT
jgi:hypothetical protein